MVQYREDIKKGGRKLSVLGYFFYLTVVQAILLYGSGSWVVTKRDLGKLDMTVEHIQKIREGGWIYPDHQKLLLKCKLFTMETYLEGRRETLWEYLQKK